MKTYQRLTESDIAQAILFLNGWTGKLTWKRYSAILATQIGHVYTKAGLRKHTRILTAWGLAKNRLLESIETVGANSHGDAAIAHGYKKIEMLKAENEQLKSENNDLLDMFQRWAYNASTAGLTLEILKRQIKSFKLDK
jgi:hypothetical protein